MKKKHFSFDSSDGETSIHGILWIPDKYPKMILQISHGMTEYVERYDEFGEFMAEKGVLVIGHDHLGHGLSVTEDDKYGYFAAKGGYEKVISDIDEIRKVVQGAYPKLPYYLLGFSMGSFFTRAYLIEKSKGLSGAIIMGTAYRPRMVTAVGMKLCQAMSAVKGEDYRSKTIKRLATGSFNKKHGKRGDNDWLSKNNDNVISYNEDPLSAYNFTLNGYYNMFKALHISDDVYKLVKINQYFPLLVMSGGDDPVGDYGNGIYKVYEQYKDAGCKNVEMMLYAKDRHDILREEDRMTVFEDIYAWMSLMTYIYNK